MSKRRRSRYGQGLVEFALILPVLLMVILGIFEFGRILLIYSSLFNAAREGSRYGITNPRDYDGIRVASVDRMMLIPPDDLSDTSLVVVSYDGGPDSGAPHTDYETVTAGDRVLVDVTYEIQPMTAFFAPVMRNLTLQTRARRTIQSVGTLVSAPPEEAPPPGGTDPGEGDDEDPAASPQITISPTCGPAGSATISVSGTGWTGDNQVNVDFDGENELKNKNINADGSFTFSFSVTPADGAHEVLVTGNKSNVSLSETFTVPCPGEEPKARIEISEPVREGDTELVGIAEPGEEVTLAVNGSYVAGPVTVDSEGNFVFNINSTVLNADDEVVVSGYGESDTTIVQPAEILEFITIDPVKAWDTEVTGSAHPGEEVTLWVDGEERGTALVSDLGRYGFSGLLALQPGSTIRVTGYGEQAETTVPEIVVRSPITITEPVYANSTVVSGQAEPGYAVTLRIIQTGLRRTVTVDASGSFEFADLSPLVTGHTVVVEGYGEQDSVIVESDPTDAYIAIDETCLASGNQTFIIHGHNIPDNSNSYKKLAIYWNGSLVGTPNYDNKAHAFDETITVNVSVPGPHTLRVDVIDNQGNAHLNITPISIPVCVTESPESAPDLIVTGLSVRDDPMPGTYERVHLDVSIQNIGDVHVTSLFWVDLFVDFDPDSALADQPSVDYVAVNALSAGSTITFTMYVPNGFEETGTHTIAAMVDTWDQVPELVEDNNVSETLVITITESNSPPEPVVITPGPTGRLTGETTVDGEYTAGVSVYLYAADGRLVASGRSVTDGLYGIDEIPVGEYSLVGEYRQSDAYATTTTPIAIDEGLNEADIILTTMEGTSQ